MSELIIKYKRGDVLSRKSGNRAVATLVLNSPNPDASEPRYRVLDLVINYDNGIFRFVNSTKPMREYVESNYTLEDKIDLGDERVKSKSILDRFPSLAKYYRVTA